MEAALNATVLALEAIEIDHFNVRAAVLQNRLALDMITAAQGNTCTMLHQECCIHIPDVQSLINHSEEALCVQSSKIQQLEDYLFLSSTAAWFNGIEGWQKLSVLP